MPHERVGRYHIIRPLAAGGMGELFLAEHTGLSGFAKRVVVKRISKSYAKHPSYVDLFLNEARVGSFLNHPNIVHIFDVGREGDDLWLVMEYVDGIDLKRLLRRANLAGHRLSPRALIAIMVEVLSALEEAHAGGPMRGEPIIHRDISPENILIARSGAIKVLDFGLAKWAPGRHAVPSMEGKLIFGKLRYMPPEQLRGRLIDVRADLFAIGVVLYEALTDRLPFIGNTANHVLQSILQGRPPSPSESFGKKDEALDALVLRAIEKEPDERFQSARQMREAFVEYLANGSAILPLEEVRVLLRPGSVLAQTDKLTPEQTGTEIGLPVAKRCGKCGGRFKAYFFDGLILDRCSSCGGVWLDFGEIDRILGRTDGPLSFQMKKIERAPLDSLIGSCPECKVGLGRFEVPDQPAHLEVCNACFGVWFDHGELDLMRQDDIVTWFRVLLEALRLQPAV